MHLNSIDFMTEAQRRYRPAGFVDGPAYERETARTGSMTILVGADGSATANKAVDAATLAGQLGAELYILPVYRPALSLGVSAQRLS